MPPESKPLNSTQCRRCGTCCRKGGPALHVEDQDLVEKGHIALGELLTFREGELVYDNVAGRIVAAATDIIKVTTASDHDRGCCFYEAGKSACAIYTCRPIECRSLQCWDPGKVMHIYSRDRLTRRHLLSKIIGLWDMVQEHQHRCDYGRLASLATALRQRPGDGDAQNQLMEMIRYDQGLREATMARTGYDTRILAFLFGRPLVETIGLFRLRLIQTDQGPVLAYSFPGSDA
jgi:Fe-S-cluster containining protein